MSLISPSASRGGGDPHASVHKVRPGRSEQLSQSARGPSPATSRPYPYQQFRPLPPHTHAPTTVTATSPWPASAPSSIPPATPAVLSPAALNALLATPLSPRVAQAMRAHRAALAGDPLAHIIAHEAHEHKQEAPHVGTQPPFAVHAPSQLALPLEFIQQQQQKLLAQQQAQIAQEGRTDVALLPVPGTLAPPLTPSPTHGRSRSHHAGMLSPRAAYGALLSPRSQLMPRPRLVGHSGRSPVRPGTAMPHPPPPPVPQYVPADLPDLGYENTKKREGELVSLLARSAQTDRREARAAAAQLETRGSVRFDTSDPKRIFDELRARASKPLDDSDLIYNAKHQVKLKDGTVATVFGSVLARPDTVRGQSISQFFVQRDRGEHTTLEQFASANFNRDARVSRRDVLKSERHNRSFQAVEHRTRIERTEEQLLALGDDVLTPLERWKRDQLRARALKETQEAEAARAQAARTKEALKLRLERERFEREEREAREKELAALQAREEEERQRREEEKLRAYRTLVADEAEVNKRLKLEAENALKAEEEAEKARATAEATRRKKALAEGSYTPSFMSPLSMKISREQTQQDLALIGRFKDTEKDWKIGAAKLKAELVRLNELIRKREKHAQSGTGAGTGTGGADQLSSPTPGSSTLSLGLVGGDSAPELRDEVRRVRVSGMLTVAEEIKLKELERMEGEARGWMDKAQVALENHEAAQAREAARNANSSNSSTNTPANTNTRALRRATVVSTTTPSESAATTPSSSNANLLGMAAHNSGRNVTHSPGGAGGESTLNEEDEEDEEAGNNTRTTSQRSSRRRSLKWDAAAVGGGSQRSHRGGLDRIISGVSTDGAKSATNSRPHSKAGSRRHSIASSINDTSSHMDVKFDESSMGNGATASRRMSADVSGALTPTANDATSPSHSADMHLVESVGPDGEPVHTYVNEKTLAIDQARQAMLTQQADFEARIKALTSFSTTATSPTSKRKTVTAASNKSKRKTVVKTAQ